MALKVKGSGMEKIVVVQSFDRIGKRKTRTKEREQYIH